jgi:hypothetical protein
MELMAPNVYQQFFVLPIKVTQLTRSKRFRKQPFSPDQLAL